MAQHNSKTPAAERDSWRTPRWLFDWLNARFSFDVDLAAEEGNALCAYFCTEESDALVRPWHGVWSRGFLNCPYSDIDPWVDKAIHEQRRGFLTVMVMPSPNGEERFGQVFSQASEIIDIVGLIAFLKPDGTPVSGNTRGTSVYIFDPARMGAPCQRWWVRRDELIKRHERKTA